MPIAGAGASGSMTNRYAVQRCRPATCTDCGALSMRRKRVRPADGIAAVEPKHASQRRLTGSPRPNCLIR